MNTNIRIVALFLIILVGMTFGIVGCGQKAPVQKTDITREGTDPTKEKEELVNKRDALSKESQRLESEQKKAEIKKNEKATIDSVEYERMFISSPDGTLNLRSGQSGASDILAVGKNGEWVEVIKEGKTWSKVRFNGKTGYMGTKFLMNTRNY